MLCRLCLSVYSGRTAQNSVSLRCALGWGLSVGYLNICVLVQHAVSQIVSANVLSMELVGHVALQMQQVSGLLQVACVFFKRGQCMIISCFFHILCFKDHLLC